MPGWRLLRGSERLPALAGAGERVDPVGRELELRRGGADLLPGLVVHRHAVALALRAVFALGLARDAHAIVARGRARGAQPGEEALRILGEGLLGSQARGI